MFDIGWSELMVIAVVALIAIGPKELPGVLRSVGQWIAKARKMAGEFQGQFQEAMREAEMADLKKSFDEVKDAATGFTSGNVMTSLQKDVSDSLQIPSLDKPAEPPVDAQVASLTEPPLTPTTPAEPTPSTFVEAETHAAANEPLIITREHEAAQQEAATKAAEVTATEVTAADVLKDAKAS